jgi:hypothetical protein
MMIMKKKKQMLKLKIMMINLKNNLRSKIQDNELKFYEMSLITS